MPDTPTMMTQVYGWAEFPNCPPKIALVAAIALIFGRAGFFEGDRDGLATALHGTALSAAAALEFAVLELMHDPAGDPFLTG